ncbi:MAG: nitroreductase family protein [Desulfurococcales archaeon]|nr:nitroreductase family protein [Desulfurococcales archaeon]
MWNNFLLKIATSRKSTRKYSSEPVSLDNILYAIQVALQAPSGANRQPWRFILVMDGELKHELREISEEWERKFHDSRALPRWFKEWLHERNISWQKPFLEEAPILIVVLTDRKAPYGRESTWLAIGYLLLALEERGLASLTYTPSNPHVIARRLGVPDNYTLEAIIPVGKSGEAAEKEPRLKPSDAVYLDKWGGKLGSINHKFT